MTQKQVDRRNENGVGPHNRPDPEILPRSPKAERRDFTAVYNQWVLEEAEKCRELPGGIGASGRVVLAQPPALYQQAGAANYPVYGRAPQPIRQCYTYVG